MKRIFSILLWISLLCTIFAGCGKRETSISDHTNSQISKPDSTIQNIPEDTMYIIIDRHILTVKMEDNSSSKALITLLKDGDITVKAHDYGSFEKVGALGAELPTNDEQITTEPGDVILYQGNQFTVYYDTNSWRFTRLGKVQGVTADELKAILGDGDVTMVLSLKKPGSTA